MLRGMDTASHYDAARDVEPMLFSALLTPHRSLSGNGFLLLTGFFGAASLVAGIAFLAIGAWPVLGFLGIDLVAIVVAFRLNAIRARACEQVLVTPSELRVRRISPGGRRVEVVLNPRWVRLDQVGRDAFGIEQLFLVSSGRRVGIASCLGAEEKASFAKALSAALAAARRGPDRPSPQPCLSEIGW